MVASPTRVAVALGGGGGGYAHIGVMEVLEERGFQVTGVAGASMGAVVGGLYAAGRLRPYTEWVRTLTYREVFRLLDPTFRAPGAIRAEKVLDRMRELLGDIHIEDLPIHFTAVATDLAVITRYRMAGSPPDLLISVPKDACGTLDFHQANELIEIGRQQAAQAPDESGVI